MVHIMHLSRHFHLLLLLLHCLFPLNWGRQNYHYNFITIFCSVYNYNLNSYLSAQDRYLSGIFYLISYNSNSYNNITLINFLQIILSTTAPFNLIPTSLSSFNCKSSALKFTSSISLKMRFYIILLQNYSLFYSIIPTYPTGILFCLHKIISIKFAKFVDSFYIFLNSLIPTLIMLRT